MASRTIYNLKQPGAIRVLFVDGASTGARSQVEARFFV